MTIKELAPKNQAELSHLLKSEREHLRELRFKVGQGQHKDVREIRETRQNIARILTLLQSSIKAKR